MPPSDGPDDVGLEVTDEEWQRIYRRTQHLPGDQYYGVVLPDGTPGTGDVADDIADIYRALKPGLEAWDLQRDELLAGTVWLWKHSHGWHWGAHLSGLQDALQPMVERNERGGLVSGEDVFIAELLARHPEWASDIVRTPTGGKYRWSASAAIPSPTGDKSRELFLWLEGTDPSIGFGSNWHMHAQDMGEFWEHVEALLGDQLELAVDVGGEHDGFETVVDLRDEDALLDHVTSAHSAPRTRLKSFAGTQDREIAELA